MSTVQRRMAARANQRAAAFVRFHMLGDHEAMHGVLAAAGEDELERLGFVTALAGIASTMAENAVGRDRALEYLGAVAATSAALEASDDIDRWFDDPGSR